MKLPSVPQELLALGTVLRRAADAIPSGSRSRVVQKADGTPVTDADLAVHQALLSELPRLTDVPVLSEESWGEWEGEPNVFWLIDPIDGTTDFIAGRAEWGVNAALIQHGVPVLGGIFAPDLGQLYLGAQGKGAWRDDAHGWKEISPTRRLRSEGLHAKGLRVLVSVGHRDAQTDAHIGELPMARSVEIGSSLKFCRLAEGVADYYPRLKGLHGWDIAAGHAILLGAGADVYRFGTRDSLQYSSLQVLTPPFQAY